MKIDNYLKLFGYNKLFNHFVYLDQNHKLPSRILLTGQEGIGKTAFSLHLINYLLSKNEDTKYDYKDNIINSDSSSLIHVQNFSHPNFYCISKSPNKKSIEIEQVREAILFLNKSSFNNNMKIILIDAVEDLNLNSSNALLKSLEESNAQNLFLLNHNINKNLSDTIRSRCLSYKLTLDHSEIENILTQYFKSNVYDELNTDFKSINVSPKFLINHINFAKENNLDLKNLDIKSQIQYIIDHKSYKKSNFIATYFQNYIEIYFAKMYSLTKDYRYYDNYLNIIFENSLINKFNLDLDIFFIKFEEKYLNI